MNHLVIGDAHVAPGQDLRRFVSLGNYVLHHKPEVIIFMGDLEDMPSLCSYDKGTRGFVGRKYKDDVESVKKALKLFFEPIWKYNAKKKARKKKQYLPRIVLLGGNHGEARINRAIEADHVLEGTIGMEDFEYDKFGIEYVPYLDIINIDGINYSHCIKHRNSAMMIAGLHHANSLLQKRHASVTVGHSHLLDYKTDVIEGGRRIHGLVAGCFFEEDKEYAKQNNACWWRGIIHKRNVKDGTYDPEFISLERLLNEY